MLALRTGRRFLVVSGWSVVVGLFDHDVGPSTIDYWPWTIFRFGQAIKGVWWMPWGKEPMKGAASGETRRGGANTH